MPTIINEVDGAAGAKPFISSTWRKGVPGPRHSCRRIRASSQARADGADIVWIIDPLDGTTKTLSVACRHFMLWSIALPNQRARSNMPVRSDPVRQEELTASRGRGRCVERQAPGALKAREKDHLDGCFAWVPASRFRRRFRPRSLRPKLTGHFVSKGLGSGQGTPAIRRCAPS